MNVYGGYQIVDFKGTALGSTAKTIAGVFPTKHRKEYMNDNIV